MFVEKNVKMFLTGITVCNAISPTLCRAIVCDLPFDPTDIMCMQLLCSDYTLGLHHSIEKYSIRISTILKISSSF